ncbi:uncharacterized protein BYT42DRAFT_363197 [Radiomyces spectabilis]|uniref:uncharacterized protein n=1 Tax=Radiomyces spectabilis TaxID=64574 RepID=UPI0022203EF3|nr:uncharacterized protein BYT42DRAFT_363197 [Radiomyces spectabilis]KAI8377965.1 hypothetical protein BYT42DRAFT_363197 [Radiomyces spectabilis]
MILPLARFSRKLSCSLCFSLCFVVISFACLSGMIIRAHYTPRKLEPLDIDKNSMYLYISYYDKNRNKLAAFLHMSNNALALEDCTLLFHLAQHKTAEAIMDKTEITRKKEEGYLSSFMSVYSEGTRAGLVLSSEEAKF